MNPACLGNLNAATGTLGCSGYAGALAHPQLLASALPGYRLNKGSRCSTLKHSTMIAKHHGGDRHRGPGVRERRLQQLSLQDPTNS